MADSRLVAWLERRREESGLTVRRIPAGDCGEWLTSGPELRHVTGRYFQVVGVRVTGGPYDGWEQPMIRQTEVGILGFLVRSTTRGREWLLQAKTEPGNVGGTQVGPSVQATESNYQRVHGGDPTRHLEWFTSDRGTTESDVLASEQGTRFTGKLNRNSVVSIVEGDDPVAGGAWEWFDASDVREALVADFVLNTDARSVLVTAPWHLLADEAPFQRWASDPGFPGRVARSYRAAGDGREALDLLADERRDDVAIVEEVPLGDLTAWRRAASGIEPVDGDGVGIAFVHVDTRDREVARWCQPLLTAPVAGCELWCQEREGVLRVLFRVSREPGLRNGVELAPTNQSDLAATVLAAPAGVHAVVRLAARQSDEGGRFLETVCRYRVIELGAGAFTPPPGFVWLTVGEIEALARRPATFTNEARSAISLLLHLA
jgi:dTDP-4-dehydro-6-deoxy-alpha-D-glucopyranose 2,3-dehydratase